MIARLTIFTGAFLAFLVQPLVGNTLLPVFGGTAMVWSACLAGFQTLLVAGYFYAHCVGRDEGRGKREEGRGEREEGLGIGDWGLGKRVWWHVGVLALAAGGLLAVVTGAGGKSIAVLLPAVAFAYVVLSANSSLVQLLAGGKYKLYAVSNFGSMMGLLAYPLLFEPFLALSTQWLVFAALATGYAVMFALLAMVAGGAGAAGTSGTCETSGTRDAGRETGTAGAYFALAFVSCYLLNAVSTHLCTDITPLPLLWVWLLVLYLASYIAAFTDRGSRFAPWSAAVLVPVALWAVCTFGSEGSDRFLRELALGSCLLLFGGWIVHSRLYRLRPPAAGLTRYYLMIALGGAAGGATCSFVMPQVSNIVAEYPIAIALVLGVVLLDGRDLVLPRLGRLGEIGIPRPWLVRGAVAFLLLVAGVGIVGGLSAGDGRVLARYRNFYGIGYVTARTIPVEGGISYQAHEFTSNGTIHGFQKAEGEWKGYFATTYYGEHAGGLPLLKHPKRTARQPMRVALCGMGIGALATYARQGDFYRFYEINPDVVRLATDERLFSFVPKAEGEVDIVVDDARKALSRERDGGEAKYDVIVADVFNGDAIPPHMATREAVQLYLDRLEEDGILAFHLSNWHLDLLPLVKAAAAAFDLKIEAYTCRASKFSYVSTWAFLSRRPLDSLYDAEQHTRIECASIRDIPLMTDDFHSLLPYIRKDIFDRIK